MSLMFLQIPRANQCHECFKLVWHVNLVPTGAVPELRTKQSASSFNSELARSEYDLKLWR